MQKLPLCVVLKNPLCPITDCRFMKSATLALGEQNGNEQDGVYVRNIKILSSEKYVTLQT